MASMDKDFQGMMSIFYIISEKKSTFIRGSGLGNMSTIFAIFNPAIIILNSHYSTDSHITAICNNGNWVFLKMKEKYEI